MDEDSSDGSPRRPSPPTRNLPTRQAKIKPPVRATRSTSAFFTSPSTTQASSAAETDRSHPTPQQRNTRPVRTKRKPDYLVASRTPTKSVKRQRIQLPVRKAHIPHRHSSKRPATEDEIENETTTENRLLAKSQVFPPWSTLPYLVWRRIFHFVAVPIRDDASRIDDVTGAVGSLLSGARVCKATLEPSLAELYKCPPFHRACFNKAPQTSFMQFVDTLALPPSETLIHYRPKVEIVRIDVDTFLSRKLGGVQYTLKRVVQGLPRLSHLELYHPSDDPPYRELKTHLRWKLSEEDLFDALAPLPDADISAGERTRAIALQSWRWNSRLVPETMTLDRLPEIHTSPNFQDLRKLAYVNYQLPSLTLNARARQSEEALASDFEAIGQLAASISALPRLEHLVIESSTLANGSLLERLPKTLTHLELINCCEVTSEDLSKFLMSHGHSLMQLTLKHCQCLSLAFLPVLGISCPKLTHLEVDLSYFRHHAAYADNKPEYATLLQVDEVPTWPCSIQSIEIINMRNWTREAAEMFFGSLMQNSKALPNLRHLEFKVILNIEWRQRQEMRKSLAKQMTRIFKRQSPPPQELTTLRQSKEMKLEDSGELETLQSPVRRSTRIIDKSSTPVSGKSDALPFRQRNLGRILPVRRSLRSLKSVSSTFDADDEESSEDELSICEMGARPSKSRITVAKKVGIQKEEFIQGLCDVVDIQVDNQRPAERQYDMEDFLDDPEESDPEWNSDDDDVYT